MLVSGNLYGPVANVVSLCKRFNIFLTNIYQNKLTGETWSFNLHLNIAEEEVNVNYD